MNQSRSSSDDKTLVCRFCEVIPETLLLEDGSYRLHCRTCGGQADRDVAVRIASEHAARNIVDEYRHRIRRSFAGLQHVTHIPGRRSESGTPEIFIFM